MSADWIGDDGWCDDLMAVADAAGVSIPGDTPVHEAVVLAMHGPELHRFAALLADDAVLAAWIDGAS